MKIQTYKLVKIKVSEDELNKLEDFVMCWNLCKKHNATINIDEIEMAKTQASCKACQRAVRKVREPSKQIMFRLWRAYDKPKNAKIR